MMLEELRKVIPSFLQRLDRPERGGVWAAYMASTQARPTRRSSVLGPTSPQENFRIGL